MRPLRPTSTKQLGTSLRAWGRARDGGVAVTVVVMSTVLVGILAIAIDLGRAYNLSTELDNAADAYALAGATQLGTSCVAAIEAAAAAGNTSALVNTETFASNPSGSDVYVDPTPSHVGNSNIRFLTDLSKDANGNLINYITDPDPAECDDTAEFIEVTIDQASANDPYRVDFSFAGLLGATGVTFPKGYAVAGYNTLYCGIAPLMVCELEPNFWQNMVNDPTYYRGVGVWAKAGKPSETWGPGNAAFLNLGGGGTNGLCDNIGMVNPEEACFGTDNLETEPGNNTGARHCYNTRFDIYHGSLNGSRNDPQWQPAANTVKGRVKNGCNDPGWAVPGTPYNGPGTMPLPPPADAAMPLSPDNCAFPAPGGCIPVGAQGRMGDGVWDLETYLAVNHPGIDYADAMSEIMETCPTGPFGRPDCVTRYDVYKWELGYPAAYAEGDYGGVDSVDHNLVNNVPVPDPPLPQPLGGGPTLPDGQIAEYGGPQCYTGPMGDVGVTLDKDRRILRIAVVDCTSGKNPPMRGRTTVVAEGFMDVFLLSPWKDANTNHELYFEILGRAEDQEYDKTPKRHIVHLYE